MRTNTCCKKQYMSHLTLSIKLNYCDISVEISDNTTLSSLSLIEGVYSPTYGMT